MALTNIRLPTASADVTAVYDQDFNQVFANARPIKAQVNVYSKVMEHPLETGSVITDHSVLMPNEVELSLILISGDFDSVYQQIKQLYQQKTLLTIQTKADLYTNMIISDMPHDEDPAMFDVLSLAMKLKEVQFVTAQFGTLPASKVRDKTMASTTQKGEQTTRTPSLAFQGIEAIGSVFQ